MIMKKNLLISLHYSCLCDPKNLVVALLFFVILYYQFFFLIFHILIYFHFFFPNTKCFMNKVLPICKRIYIYLKIYIYIYVYI